MGTSEDRKIMSSSLGKAPMHAHTEGGARGGTL